MQKRKTKVLDGTDKDILQVLYESPSNNRRLAKKVGLSPSAVAPRLDNLCCLGLLKKTKVRDFRYIWEVDLK